MSFFSVQVQHVAPIVEPLFMWHTCTVLRTPVSFTTANVLDITSLDVSQTANVVIPH